MDYIFTKITLLILLILSILSGIGESKKLDHSRKRIKKKKDDGLTLSSGLKIQFSDKAAASSLKQWAKEIESSGGTVSHSQAVYREREVICGCIL